MNVLITSAPVARCQWVLTIDTHSHVTQATNGSQVAWELLKNLDLSSQPNPTSLPPNLSMKTLFTVFG